MISVFLQDNQSDKSQMHSAKNGAKNTTRCHPEARNPEAPERELCSDLPATSKKNILKQNHSGKDSWILILPNLYHFFRAFTWGFRPGKPQ